MKFKTVKNQYIINEEREGFARELLAPTRLSDDVTRDIERMSIMEVIS